MSHDLLDLCKVFFVTLALVQKVADLLHGVACDLDELLGCVFNVSLLEKLVK